MDSDVRGDGKSAVEGSCKRLGKGGTLESEFKQEVASSHPLLVLVHWLLEVKGCG